MTRALTLEEVKDRSIEDVLRDVAFSDDVVRVDLGQGEAVELRSALKLKPLIRFPGAVRPGWKDAIYDE